MVREPLFSSMSAGTLPGMGGYSLRCKKGNFPMSEGLTEAQAVDKLRGLIQEIPIAILPMLTTRLKIMAELDIVEFRIPQDGRFSVFSDGILLHCIAVTNMGHITHINNRTVHNFDRSFVQFQNVTRAAINADGVIALPDLCFA